MADPTVAFHTLGCKVNFYDTEAVWNLFKEAGYRQVPFDGRADVYVVNTCAVTHTGDRKSRQTVRRAVRNNPEATVVAMGCYAQIAPGEVLGIPGVDLVLGTQHRGQIVPLVEKVRREREPYSAVTPVLKEKEFEDLDVPSFHDRTRASLKIQDGCNHFCTFCIIPYARGLLRSRRPESVLRQASRLAEAGYKEIVLTGIHTGGYGEDLDGYTLASLLRDLEGIPDLRRIRISSIEASEITDELIETLAGSQKVCRHLHIPLQAGHDEVLRRMNRRYTVAQYARRLDQVRAALPDLAVTSDVIVGFPGETDGQFRATAEFVERQGFAQLHVFPYSRRDGTPAARFSGQVPEAEKERRVARMIALSQTLSENYANKWRGKVLGVIPEERIAVDGAEYLVGHADNYMKIAFRGEESLLGEVCAVRVEQTGAEWSFGAWVDRVGSALSEGS